MELKGKRVAILVDQQYQEMEVWYPYYRLIEAGCIVHFAGAEKGQAFPSKTGYPCTTHLSYDELNSNNYDGVICPGGFAPDFIRRHPKSSQFIAELDGQGKLVAAICHGVWCCCSAKILKGRRCTSFFAIKDDVAHAGGVWEDSEVVVDHNLVTSRKPDDLPAFMKSAMRVLAGKPPLE